MKSPESKSDKRYHDFPAQSLTLGLIFAIIGTSPLYTMRAAISGAESEIGSLMVLGVLSCIFWTLTVQTTIKYIVITLRTDNNGEGGIFALFSLMRKKSTFPAVLTMVGGAALFANGILTPSITVTSSLEGFRTINENFNAVPIVIIVFIVLFLMQRLKTSLVRNAAGPVMIVWYVMIGLFGLIQIFEYPAVIKAFNPVYAYMFLSEYPGGFLLLGAVFLCTTGAEVIYSEMGRAGRINISISWIFLKFILILSYFGQGAWMLVNNTTGEYLNPFFSIIPQWFLIPGILISVSAAIVASQAIISSSYSLIREAVSFNFWPKIRVTHPTADRDRIYLPFVNWFLLISCCFTVLLFRDSENMEAAYGLTVNIAMIFTTVMLSFYLYKKGSDQRLVLLLLMLYLIVEGSFLISYLHDIPGGGWFSVIVLFIIFIIIYSWYFGRKIKNRYITFSNLDDYIEMFKDLRNDESVPYTATNLVYIIRANRTDQVESKVIYSIFRKQPKRAKTYWLLHVNIVDDPNSFEYVVKHLIPGILIRVDFNIGFKVEPRINLYFSEVLEDLVKSGEIECDSCYDSLKKHDFPGDFRYILIDRVMPKDNPLSGLENLTLSIHNITRILSTPDVKALQLDSINTIEEQVPITVDQPVINRITRKN